MTGQPTHTQRGFYPTQRGFWLISRAPSGFKLGLESEEKVSQTTHKQAHTRGSSRGLNQGQDHNQRLSWHQWQTQDTTRACKTMQDSNWPTISPFVIDDNWQQAPPQGELPLTRTSLLLNISPPLASMAKGSWLEEVGCWRRMTSEADEDGTPSIDQEIY